MTSVPEALDANANAVLTMVEQKELEKLRSQDQREIKALKKELQRKEKALVDLLETRRWYASREPGLGQTLGFPRFCGQLLRKHAH